MSVTPDEATGLQALGTEAVDDRYSDLDTRPTVGVLEAMTDAEAQVSAAVRQALPQLAELVDGAAARLRRGGRIIYVGAGTSGRLGIVDAAECPPTFYTDPEMVQAVIAGGRDAVFAAVEGAEDSYDQGRADVEALNLTADDVIIGIAASGRTPYVIGAVHAGRDAGSLTAGVSCNSDAALSAEVDHAIEVPVGPEVLAGSTRLKAGSATKQVLNMISTAVMVRNGKTYGNLMVDVAVTNAKLRDRAQRLVSRVTGCSRDEAAVALTEAGDRVKVAIVMITRGVEKTEALNLLETHNGQLRPILGQA